MQEEREETNQLTEKVTNTAIRNISNQCIECKRPRHRILHSFFELIHFEVFVSDTLLIDAHTLNGQYSIFLRQPSCIQLIVGNDPQKDQANADCEQPRGEKDNLPRRNGRSVLVCTLCDSVGDCAADDLAEAVETEP